MRRLVILLSAQVGCLAVLAALRNTFLPLLGAEAQPGDLVAVGLWAMALSAVGWLLVTTLAFLAVEMLPTLPRRLHSSVASVTPGMIRVVVTRAVAVSMLASVTALPTVGTAQAAVRTGREPAATTTTTASGVPDDAVDEPAPSPSGPQHAGPQLAGTAASAQIEYRVVPGDNLWSIAAAHLRTVTGTGPSDAQIAPYWARVVEDNRARLRSGDPDLIYPGEVVVLPAL